jgi:hypothetical protein
VVAAAAAVGRPVEASLPTDTPLRMGEPVSSGVSVARAMLVAYFVSLIRLESGRQETDWPKP